MDKILIIMNPAAKGEKALRLRDKIADFTGDAEIRLTTFAGEAQEIAAAAVREGYTTVVAAGGDGTINHVVNGIAGTGVKLGVLPIGTMNVLASELDLPSKELPRCWEIILAGQVRMIDLPKANDHHFVQLAGVGLDAQVVQETDSEFRKNFGPLSYMVSLAQIAARTPPKLTVTTPGSPERNGTFVLVGNGRYYGGPFHAFSRASLEDGLLDVLVFNGLSYLDLVRYTQTLIFGKLSDLPDIDYFQTQSLTVTCDEQIPVEVDGEVNFDVPVTFHVPPERQAVLAPPVKVE